MDQRFRRGFTAAEKTELWDRWQRGESLKAIGRAFGKPSGHHVSGLLVRR
jgi:IS30 family transposase